MAKGCPSNFEHSIKLQTEEDGPLRVLDWSTKQMSDWSLITYVVEQEANGKESTV